MTECEQLKALLRELVFNLAPAVAVLSREEYVAPDLRKDLSTAESLILGPVRAALQSRPKVTCVVDHACMGSCKGETEHEAWVLSKPPSEARCSCGHAMTVVQGCAVCGKVSNTVALNQ